MGILIGFHLYFISERERKAFPVRQAPGNYFHFIDSIKNNQDSIFISPLMPGTLCVCALGIARNTV